jgi:hypothetical protein
LRLANASLLTFAHIMNGLLDPSRRLPEDVQKRAFFTLRDLGYVSAQHFARIAQNLTTLRRHNACRALNLLNPKPFMDAPVGPDLFGEKWESLYADEVKRRKVRASSQKEKQHNVKSRRQSFSQIETNGPGQSSPRRDPEHIQRDYQQHKQADRSLQFSEEEETANQSGYSISQSFSEHSEELDYGCNDSDEKDSGGGRRARGSSHHRQ